MHSNFEPGALNLEALILGEKNYSLSMEMSFFAMPYHASTCSIELSFSGE